MSDKFAIFGERCSGTNVLEQLVWQNFKLNVTTEFGFKHWPRREFNWSVLELPVVLIAREPVGYLSSMYRSAWHCSDELKEMNFSSFIRAEWKNVHNEDSGTKPHDSRYGEEMMCERHLETGTRYRNVLEMRSDKLRQLKRIFEDVPCVSYVRFDELLSDQEAVVRRVEHELSLVRTAPEISVVDSYKGGSSFRRRLYNATLGRFISPVSRVIDVSVEDKEYIYQNLDLDIEREFGLVD